MELIVVSSECKMALKRRLQDEHIAQELTSDSYTDTHISHDDVHSQWAETK
jgi:hypothetical protein